MLCVNLHHPPLLLRKAHYHATFRNGSAPLWVHPVTIQRKVTDWVFSSSSASLSLGGSGCSFTRALAAAGHDGGPTHSHNELDQGCT